MTTIDVYAIATEKIINLLEQGIVPWRRPWISTGLPRNLESKKPYRGVNHFLLSASMYVSPFWLTMRQANELSGHLRKGEESTIVVFWKVDNARETTEGTNNEQQNENRRRFLLRYYRVFNLEQCELPQGALDKLPKIETHEHDPIEAADQIVAGMPNPPAIEHPGTKAFYSTTADPITNCREISSSQRKSTDQLSCMSSRTMPTPELCRATCQEPWRKRTPPPTYRHNSERAGPGSASDGLHS